MLILEICMWGNIWRRVKSFLDSFVQFKKKKGTGRLNDVLRITHPPSASGTGSHTILYPLEQKEQDFDPGLHHIRHFQV